ncbi:MAG: hypothetical protein OH324_02835 [Candidatus Parvarchaeota archaeon]|nr:hypothetical protein [Candidatus Rehaiarchaeum fermentans]
MFRNILPKRPSIKERCEEFSILTSLFITLLAISLIIATSQEAFPFSSAIDKERIFPYFTSTEESFFIVYQKVVKTILALIIFIKLYQFWINCFK